MTTVTEKASPNAGFTLIAVILAGFACLLVLYFFCIQLLPYALLLGVVILLGFALPYWQGKAERERRAAEAKQNEEQKWGFCSRDRDGPWLNYVDYPVVKATPIAKRKRFYSEWLIIHDGIIVVNPGASCVTRDGTADYNFAHTRTYAWDGCSPKNWFFWLALIGTPDFAQITETIRTLNNTEPCARRQVFWQRAHHASLVHDALYQYLNTIPISKNDVDQLFYDMLCESGFCPLLARLYWLAVRVFGAREIKGDLNNANTRLILADHAAGLLAIAAAYQAP